MKKLKTILLCFTLLILSSVQATETYFLVAGSGTKNITIFQKSTQYILWSHALEPGQECNSVAMNKKGEILYSYKQGAKLINLNHEEIWDYKSEVNTELQLAAVLPDGGYLLGICGSPAKIVELNKNGKVRKELSIDLKIEHPHGQFRMISKTKNGNYIIPVLGTGEILEIDGTGKEVSRFKLNIGCFSTLELKNGNLLASGGDSHQLLTIDRKSGAMIEKITEKQIPGVSLLFAAQVIQLKNGNQLICNWHGHNNTAGVDEPQLIEIDNNRQVVWTLNDKKQFDKVSSCYDITSNHYFKKALKQLKR